METKKEFRYFTIFNHEKEEKYLHEVVFGAITLQDKPLCLKGGG